MGSHPTRIAYVTGGMGGIGTAICRRLCKDGHSERKDLVNNAGITRDGMLARGWGRIVNISSVNGQRGQFGQTGLHMG
jgi:NAD(P)-dependent dehydrogenase (short-subunit alcohol dehydrogenase family)